jgi:hypothetical protein
MAKPGDLRSCRRAKRRSKKKFCIGAPRHLRSTAERHLAEQSYFDINFYKEIDAWTVAGDFLSRSVQSCESVFANEHERRVQFRSHRSGTLRAGPSVRVRNAGVNHTRHPTLPTARGARGTPPWASGYGPSCSWLEARRSRPGDSRLAANVGRPESQAATGAVGP